MVKGNLPMTIELPMTYFDPPERATAETLGSQFQRLRQQPFVRSLIDGMPEMVVVLNRERQIVMANNKAAELLRRPEEELIGLRMGDAFGCDHAGDEPAGCGTTRFCKVCGAAKAIHHTQQRGVPDVQECRISCGAQKCGPQAYDFRVWTQSLEVAGEQFTLFAVRDITDEKRREILERMFFHDVLNSASGLHGLLDIWKELDGPEAKETEEMACHLSEQLIEEIEAQRDLAAAERGDLQVSRDEIDVGQLLDSLCALYRHHSVAYGKQLIGKCEATCRLYTSEVLLRRVLGNLIKNALEASRAGQTVEVRYSETPVPTFRVHNETVMPEAVQLQMFQRSFSTKAKVGRGIGSYSVKLLTEKYLGGTVRFSSTAEEGTTFVVELPGAGG